MPLRGIARFSCNIVRRLRRNVNASDDVLRPSRGRASSELMCGDIEVITQLRKPVSRTDDAWRPIRDTQASEWDEVLSALGSRTGGASRRERASPTANTLPEMRRSADRRSDMSAGRRGRRGDAAIEAPAAAARQD